ncbi:MAG: hypothetical protein U0228_16745 [Myxococcaceae bacterium]
MRRSPRLLLLALAVGLALPAFAENERRHRPTEYQEMTDEEKAALKEKQRNRMGTWNENDLPPEYHFPWMQIGFIGLAIVIAIPFGWVAYKRFATETNEAIAAATPAPPRKRTKTAD